MTPLSLIPDLSTEDRDTLRDAWKQWGMDMQLTIFEEELSELGEAITLTHIDHIHWSEQVFEELADVLICFQQIEVYLREFPTNLEGTHTLWMDVEEHAASTEVEGADPDNLLLLHSLRVVKTLAKTRRYNNGNPLWNFVILSELGALLRVMQRTEQYLRDVAWICPHPHWAEVEKVRAAKMIRLRHRLEEAKAAEGEEE